MVDRSVGPGTSASQQATTVRCRRCGDRDLYDAGEAAVSRPPRGKAVSRAAARSIHHRRDRSMPAYASIDTTITDVSGFDHYRKAAAR